MEVLGVGTFNLGRDVSDTESSSHSEVRDHSTSEDHGGEPTNQHRPLGRSAKSTYQWKTLAFLWTLADMTKTPITPRVKRVKTTHRAVCPVWVEWMNLASGMG